MPWWPGLTGVRQGQVWLYDQIIRNLQLFRAIDSEYIRGVADIGYGMENYDAKPMNVSVKLMIEVVEGSKDN